MRDWSLAARHRFGWRPFGRHFSLKLAAAVTLGLGLGLVVCVFSILNGSFLRGLPFHDPDQIVTIRVEAPVVAPSDLRAPSDLFLRIREHQTSFSGIAAYSASYADVTNGIRGTGTYVGAYVTSNLFQVLGAKPLFGRSLQQADDLPGAPAVGLLGFAAWHELFGADPRVLGRTILVNREPVTVVGVMPEGFAFPFRQQIWTPLRLDASWSEGLSLFVVGRLKKGVGAGKARGELQTLAAELNAGKPVDQRLRIQVQPYTVANTDERFRRSMVAILVAALLLYLLCSSNLLHVMLVTTRSRIQDFAVRTALGASKPRLALLLLAEWFPWILVSGVLSVGVAQLGIFLFTRIARLSGQLRAFWVYIHLDFATYLVLMVLVLGVSFLAVLLPVFYEPEAGIGALLHEGSSILSNSRVLRTSRALAVIKVAVSASLLIPALLVSRSLSHLRHQGQGLADASVLTAKLSLFNASYQSDRERDDFCERLLTSVGTFPAIQTAALSSLIPTEGRSASRVEIARPRQSSIEGAEAWELAVTPGFFQIFSLSLLKGRSFELSRRGDEARVAVVSRSFADRYLGGMDAALDGRIRLQETGGAREGWLTVIGVVPDLQLGSFERPLSPSAVYRPLSLQPANTVYLFVKTHSDPKRLAPQVRSAVAAADPHVAWSDLRTMDEVVARSAWTYRFFGLAFLVFGTAALVVAGIGLFSVLSFVVASRKREMGLRSALGATVGDLVRQVLKEGISLVVIGTLAGLVGVAPAVRFMRSVLFDLDPAQAPTYLGAAGVLLLLGTLACLGPALRAASADPAMVMRQELP